MNVTAFGDESLLTTGISPMHTYLVITLLLLALCSVLRADAPRVDDAAAAPGQWGARPADGAVSMRTPPPLSWRPQKRARSYEVQIARDDGFADIAYHAEAIGFNVHCPSQVLPPGRYGWRFRFVDGRGDTSAWSRTRTFTVAVDAAEFPLPTRAELLSRIPDRHPRLFLRPEDLPRLRELARGRLAGQYKRLVAACEKLMADPPDTAEPPKYPADVDRRKTPDRWREIWWGNRTYTIRLLNGAATLGFTYRLGGHEPYGQLARKLLMAAAQWDPKGSTCMKYNDEAAMPYNYYFSRTYTYVNDLLTDAEKAACREVMRVRGGEMYDRLHGEHLWRPYGSHANRAWHFLGEIAIAFHGEIDEADDWIWFAMNVFANVYPVWCDDDGGWHEGIAYWRSYINRFTWWADAMRTCFDIDAFELPYFSKAGDYAMYLQPPGAVGGGFGDLNARQKAERNRELMTTLAAQASNPYWQWYVERIGGADPAEGYIGFIRGALPAVEPGSPEDLPASRLFKGVGLAVLNTDITDAGRNVEIVFKSSPFGTQSHGYESSNSFLLYAYGDRLLIRSGRRDLYGSPHHKNWMWQTRSTNCITVNGRGQQPHSPAARGEISEFSTSATIDYLRGEAAGAYPADVERFTRSILFVKPDLIVIHDRLKADRPSTFEWLLHAPVPMTINGAADITVAGENGCCHAAILAPSDLKVGYTDKFDPPPLPRIRLTEYHLTASTREPATEACFVTVLRPYRTGGSPQPIRSFEVIDGGYLLKASTARGEAVIFLRREGDRPLQAGGWHTTGEIAAVVLDDGGGVMDRFVTAGSLDRSD